MKLNKMINFALTMGLTMGALTVGTALAQKVEGVKMAPINTNLAITPDLEVKIEAFEDEACTKPISNGGSTVYSGGAPANFVRLSVKNKGAVKAENFPLTYAVRRSGVDVFKTPELLKLTLNPNESKVFPVVKVQLVGVTNEVTASIVANMMKIMPEANMNNNNAKFKFTGKVVH
jgi:hypothetical protein